MRFAGAVAVVTGASPGIGRATAGLLAAEGATVAAAARNGNRPEELAGEASGTVQPVACDCRRAHGCRPPLPRGGRRGRLFDPGRGSWGPRL